MHIEKKLSAFAKIYYTLKPLIPNRLQYFFRILFIKYQLKINSSKWPIYTNSVKSIDSWNGWPEGKQFALVLTHDVETKKGHDRCYDLANFEINLGFRSSFNFVAEDYILSPELRNFLIKNGFEIGVHGLKHDGKLYFSYSSFKDSSIKINDYLRDWNSVGFRSPAMHHNLEWLHDLKIVYDSSTFDFDPFEPQSDGVNTIFPFWVKNKNSQSGYIELPYTIPQDSTLFIYLREKDISIWKRKIDWIAENGGMALLITHPDYMNFNNTRVFKQYPIKFYKELLLYIKEKYKGKYWHVLPKEIAGFWKKIHNQSTTTKDSKTAP